MTAQRRAEVVLPTILDELARGPYPDYIDDALRTTARTRQRPGWTFPKTWLRRFGFGHGSLSALEPRWRLVAVAALVAAILVTMLVVLTVGGPRRVPAPFGPARSGLVAIERGADLFTVDPGSGIETTLVVGSTADVGPRFSPDGTHVLFERKLDPSRSQIWMVQLDDRNMQLLTPDPIVLAPAAAGRQWERYAMAPDGRTVLIATIGRRGPGISIAQVDGSSVRRLDAGRAATEPSFRPPDGREILFVGRGRTETGLFAIDPTTSTVRVILTVARPFEIAGASWSPDGSRIAYWMWNGSIAGLTARSHIVLADGTGDRVLPSPPGAIWNAHATWSNDGTRLFVAHGFTPSFADVRGYVLPADGSTAGVEVAPSGFVEKACCAAWMWSPDDTRILGRPAPNGTSAAQQVIIEVATRTPRVVPWSATSDPTWQRLAP